MENSTDDEIVTADDDGDRKDKHEGEAREDVGLVAHISGYSVKRTSFCF
jgi:hypothetical protein